MFKLADEHLEVAQEIAQKHRRKKHCDHCYDRGWIGINEQNLLVLCPHCVDRMLLWKNGKPISLNMKI
jgi:Zn finger protein HypA/HybF involved in hydrogenase expression